MIKMWLIIFTPVLLYGQDVKTEKMDYGVVRYYREGESKPWFFRQIESAYNVAVGKHLPFKRSIGFLVGVSIYQNISPQLPSVNNDLEQMKEFLLKEGGFDELFIVKDEYVNRDLLERYFKDVLPKYLKEGDRLLFYFSGHGADDAGHTGYMQFSGAKKGQFWGSQVLELKSIYAWSKNLKKASHQLLIFDCCASGLAISAKSGSEDCKSAVLGALSGKTSRAIMTAGTANQKTYVLRDRGERGYSIFTRAFLNSFRNLPKPSNQCTMLSTYEIFGYIQKQVANFSVNNDRRVTPKLWADPQYEGAFIFTRPEDKNLTLSLDEAEALGIISKSDHPLISTAQISIYKEGIGITYPDDGKFINFLDENLGSVIRILSVLDMSLSSEESFKVAESFGIDNFRDNPGIQIPIDTYIDDGVEKYLKFNFLNGRKLPLSGGGTGVVQFPIVGYFMATKTHHGGPGIVYHINEINPLANSKESISFDQHKEISKLDSKNRRIWSNPPHFLFIESLPAFRQTAYKEAHKGWDTGVTAKMNQANHDLINFLEYSWLRLAEFYPENHFGEEGAESYISSFIKSRFNYHWKKFEVGVNGGTIIGTMVGGDVISDMEEMILDSVFAISMNLEKKEFDFLQWKGRWQEDHSKKK
ncbi:Caspase family protein [Sulfidibacter corallicola]|uniref:Caspase family protein n=1 Tax=Sulfidibacter corallicola TaxID=2818388 RepID=A0A8A4TL71_SULCO|nr:caspase family protein [Sulfidibacter corallicola]QTD50706.1 caspase family protein [Sulfidibacter corallicola]